MSLPVPPNMSSSAVSHEQDSFHSFFDSWLVGQNHHLQQLQSAASQLETHSLSEQERVLRPLMNKVFEHYKEYYRVKSGWRAKNVLTMLSPTWTSSLEDAFLWIGGWRPSMAFQLLYSKSGIQLESNLSDIIQGIAGCNNLGDLSESQLGEIDKLQRRTINEERKINEKMAKRQESVADTELVELSQMVREMVDEDRVEGALKTKEERLEKVVERADELRLRTLKGVINILKPIQAVHYLIAAAELHLRFHEWGLRKDRASNGNHHQHEHQMRNGISSTN